MNKFEEQFLGAWTLIDWSVSLRDSGAVRKPYNGNAAGHIIYSPEGWVSATLMEKGRQSTFGSPNERIALKQKLITKGPLSLAADEHAMLRPLSLASFGYVGYCGTFDATEEVVNHRVQSAFLPEMINNTLTRRYQFDGNTLTLLATFDNAENKLLWQRNA